MTLIGVLIVLLIVAAVLWLVNRRMVLDPMIKTIANVVVLIVLLLWLLQVFGILNVLDTRVGIDLWRRTVLV